MKSKQLREKILDLNKELRKEIQSEFAKSNLEQIKLIEKPNSKNLASPKTDLRDEIYSLSKNGAAFKKGEFKTWDKFPSLMDLVDILEYLEEHNSLFNSLNRPDDD